jgi:spore maturation protein CgeB
MRIVVLGLSLRSAWGNGHATTYRSLLGALARRRHDVLFLERDVPWYRDNVDAPHPEAGRLALYDDLDALRTTWRTAIAEADLVVVGSYVPEGPAVVDLVFDEARGVTAFYDIDTPITMAGLERDDAGYVRRAQVPRFDLYLSFSGGPVLETLERRFGAARARALYCSVDPCAHRPSPQAPRWDLGYLGTYSADRAAGLDMRLLEPARRRPSGRFVVAGAQFPEAVEWPGNVDRVEHVAPAEHARFFGAQRFTLNLTRAAMTEAGWSPSVRLFEAAACGVPVISDSWPGLEAFFVPGREIFVSRSADETLDYLVALPEAERQAVAAAARARVLSAHTADDRARELEAYVAECR